MSACKWSGFVYYGNPCTVTQYNRTTLLWWYRYRSSIITNRLADSQLFMYFQIYWHQRNTSPSRSRSNHESQFYILLITNKRPFEYLLIICRSILDKRTFIFCHQSNYSGSVVQDRQALRKMYGPSVLVLER